MLPPEKASFLRALVERYGIANSLFSLLSKSLRVRSPGETSFGPQIRMVLPNFPPHYSAAKQGILSSGTGNVSAGNREFAEPNCGILFDVVGFPHLIVGSAAHFRDCARLLRDRRAPRWDSKPVSGIVGGKCGPPSFHMLSWILVGSVGPRLALNYRAVTWKWRPLLIAERTIQRLHPVISGTGFVRASTHDLHPPLRSDNTTCATALCRSGSFPNSQEERQKAGHATHPTEFWRHNRP